MSRMDVVALCAAVFEGLLQVNCLEGAGSHPCRRSTYPVSVPTAEMNWPPSRGKQAMQVIGWPTCQRSTSSWVAMS